MSPYMLGIGISYKISYKDFLYGGNPGVGVKSATVQLQLIRLSRATEGT